jgi:hypothetical protein
MGIGVPGSSSARCLKTAAVLLQTAVVPPSKRLLKLKADALDVVLAAKINELK